MKIIVGSENPSKIRAAQMVVDELFPGEKVTGRKAPSGVSEQPKSDEEALAGAIKRARFVHEKTQADYAIGMEGGLQKIGERWFECGWVAVVNKEDQLGLGSSARFQASGKLIKEILAGKEMGIVIDELTGETDIKEREGAMGVVSAGHVPRDLCYSHGIWFAFGPFISDKKFWD